MQELNTSVLDAALNHIKNNANSLELVKAFSSGDSRATVLGNTVCSIALVTGDFTLANNTPSGRKVTLQAKSGTASASSSQYESGTATAGAASTLTDSGASFPDRSGKVVKITGGTGSGQVRRIQSNTGTVITVDTAWATQPDATSTYEILDDLHWVIISGTEVLAVHDEGTNQVITSGNPVNTPALENRLPQPTAV